MNKLYVLGFIFNKARTHVILLRKKRPDWQAGKLNGVGGSVEVGERDWETMQRECMEEVGLDIPLWRWVGSMEGYNEVDRATWRVVMFRAFVPQAQFNTAHQCEDEEMVVAEVATLPPDVLPNLRYLIPICLDTDTYYLEVNIRPCPTS